MFERIRERFETVVVGALQAMVMIVIAIAFFELVWLFYVGVTERLVEVRDVFDLQAAVQRAFAGVMLVLLGLEILETLKVFNAEHRVRAELIVIVAIIAVARHIIQIDFEHMDAWRLLAIGALVLALTSGYYLLKRGTSP
jgi:uncharacterized membrane protein (DUF373 family)